MEQSYIFLIALALAVDAFAVALAAGVSIPQVTHRHTFRLAWHFGLFQAGMTVAGWASGLAFRNVIESVDHWLAFMLLLLVGAKMIAESRQAPEKKEARDPTRGLTLIGLAVATSLDALAVGLSFSFLTVSIWMPALTIGVIALVLTGLGLHLGRLIKNAARLGALAEIIGGLVLIGIGFRILHEHQVF
ncbi:MAG: manganese efflux pump MntP family protein [Proteobacteria bacterium]|nr:manganese efflux pump MntP family protein [Pseudomonadota bacterium]MBU1688493.1 manganese efflux pump MntP family protein [Pseudomonadota bacterium]